MSRNASGVYSLPNAPVVTNTTIDSADENTTRSDIASELTNSLDRSGRGAMLAPLQLADGTPSLPGLTFGTDVNTGMYRIAADTIGFAVAGALALTIATTGVTLAAGLTATTGTFSSTVSMTALTATTGTFSSTVSMTALTATTGTFSSTVSMTALTATTGTFSGAISATTGTFSSTVSMTALTATTGTFSGAISTTTLTATTSLISPILDSGSTGSLSLKTNNGTEQARAIHTASAVNSFGMQGGATGNPINIWFFGETNVGAQYNTFGTGSHLFTTGSANLAGAGILSQFEVLHTASANRYITITGSNGGNPTISTTAGSLAITPAVVIAGASLSVGTTPATSGTVNVPYNSPFMSRNSANSADIELIGTATVNGRADLVRLGTITNGNGVFARAILVNAAPAAADLPNGYWTMWRDTGGATTKLYYNNAGTIQSVALA